VSYHQGVGASLAIAWERTLATMGIELSCLFRYSVAYILGIDEIADLHKEGALLQFQRNSDAYRVYWAEFLKVLPHDFGEMADRLYQARLEEQSALRNGTK